LLSLTPEIKNFSQGCHKMGRFGHFLVGFIAGAVAMRYLPTDSQNGFWLIGLVSICLAAELLWAFREIDKKIMELLTGFYPQKLE
jgi:uncharacterized membrane protein YeaQ/YmgE (transglycosylase-associated protein family)